jgi:hypothetical protein
MTDGTLPPPSPGSPTRGPPSGTALADLFFRPRLFFQSVNLGQGRAWLAAIWIVGMSGTIDRIDRNLIQSDLGRARPGWDTFGSVITESWIPFWTVVMLGGALSAVFIWYIGGWWYNVRLRWSGAGDFPRREGRLVYTFTGLVTAIPGLAYAMIATALAPNYQAAWDAEETWSIVLLVFPFWGVIVSYLGVRTKFAVRPTPARVWFLILPLLVYAIVVGLIGMLYALLTPDAPSVTA